MKHFKINLPDRYKGMATGANPKEVPFSLSSKTATFGKITVNLHKEFTEALLSSDGHRYEIFKNIVWVTTYEKRDILENY